MPNTAGGLPYPAGSDAPDVPGDMQALAEAVDTTKIAKSIVDAKGDLIAATAADTVTRVAVGTNGQVLTANSAAASGVSWSAPAMFNSIAKITSTNASWSIPTLGSPIVRVTVIGGGGGGGAGQGNGGAGGSSSFVAGATTISAAGGLGGNTGGRDNSPATAAGDAGTAGLASANFGTGGVYYLDNAGVYSGTPGTGGAIEIGYVNLSGLTTANITIGAGGTAGTGGQSGGAGGRGEVIVEYVAG